MLLYILEDKHVPQCFSGFPIQVVLLPVPIGDQEFAARGFVVRWATVTGRMCGVPAHAQAACACCLRVSQLSVEVVRERIFMYACRQRCVGQVLRVRSLICMYASPPNMDPFFVQGLDVKTSEQIEKEAHSSWNPNGRPPLSKWLLKSQEEWAPQRLRAVGNIVIPRQATLALHILADADMKARRSTVRR